MEQQTDDRQRERADRGRRRTTTLGEWLFAATVLSALATIAVGGTLWAADGLWLRGGLAVGFAVTAFMLLVLSADKDGR